MLTDTQTTNTLQIAPVHMFNSRYERLVDIVTSYTNDKLTLCQAYHLLVSVLSTDEHGYHHSGMMFDMRYVLGMLGHRFHPTDVRTIEIGFDGNIAEWQRAGNLPIGWYCLFKDNYAWYRNLAESR